MSLYVPVLRSEIEADARKNSQFLTRNWAIDRLWRIVGPLERALQILLFQIRRRKRVCHANRIAPAVKTDPIIVRRAIII